MFGSGCSVLLLPKVFLSALFAREGQVTIPTHDGIVSVNIGFQVPLVFEPHVTRWAFEGGQPQMSLQMSIPATPSRKTSIHYTSKN